jgi:hypothetical protein
MAHPSPEGSKKLRVIAPKWHHKNANSLVSDYSFVGFAKKSDIFLKSRKICCVSRSNQLAYDPQERRKIGLPIKCIQFEYTIFLYNKTCNRGSLRIPLP